MRIRPIVPAIFVLASLSAACSQPASGVDTDDTRGVTGEPAETTEVRDIQMAAVDSPAAVEPTTAAAVEPNVPAAAKAEAVAPAAASAAPASLPLKRGYYVAADVPCGQASRADLFLVTRTGVNLNCTFKQIRKSGQTTYQVTSACSDEGGGWGRETNVETSTITYEIPDNRSFTMMYEDGSRHSARYCEQSSLPDIWRDNDISDLVD